MFFATKTQKYFFVRNVIFVGNLASEIWIRIHCIFTNKLCTVAHKLKKTFRIQITFRKQMI